MARRSTRGRAMGAHTRVGEIRAALRPRRASGGLEGCAHPCGAAPALRAEPSRPIPDPSSGTFGFGSGERSAAD